MLGFHSISEAPFSSLAEEEASVINSLKLPVEIISSIEAILESRKIPIETLNSLVESRKIPVELMGSLVESRKIPIEFLAQLVVSRKIPVEYLTQLIVTRKIPVEQLIAILSDKNIPIEIRTDVILKTFNLPIEVIGVKVSIEGLKWVLTSRNTTWTVSSELLALIWELDPRSAEWTIE